MGNGNIRTFGTMSKSYLINGRVHSPYFIFIKCAGIYSDSEILQIFGLDIYQPINSEDDAKTAKTRLYLTEDANWGDENCEL
jgi:hypothetical protein